MKASSIVAANLKWLAALIIILICAFCYQFYSSGVNKEPLNSATNEAALYDNKSKCSAEEHFLGSPAPAQKFIMSRPIDELDKSTFLQEHLDNEIDNSPEDLSWQLDVQTAIDNILIEWPKAKLLSIRCSKSACRAEFIAGTEENIEGIMDDLNNMPQIKGEKIINIADSEQFYGIAYFARNSSISLFDD